jgi:hypothetical protein
MRTCKYFAVIEHRRLYSLFRVMFLYIGLVDRFWQGLYQFGYVKLLD